MHQLPLQRLVVMLLRCGEMQAGGLYRVAWLRLAVLTKLAQCSRVDNSRRCRQAQQQQQFQQLAVVLLMRGKLQAGGPYHVAWHCLVVLTKLAQCTFMLLRPMC